MAFENQRGSRHIDPAFLASLPLFSHVPSELLTSIIDEDVLRYYQDGDVIMYQGDRADGLFMLLHGQTRILTDGIFLVTRSPYDILGELAFINQTVRNATVIAQGTVQALVLHASLVEHLMTNTIFLRNVLRLVAAKLHEATNERAFHFRNEQLLFHEFRAHLSPEIVQRLLATGKQYGMPRFIDAVLLFADIRSFTERSATMTPEQLAQELNPYLDAVVSVIHRHEGMVDKFIGDAVFALWGIAPGETDPIQQAFACAKEMFTTAASPLLRWQSYYSWHWTECWPGFYRQCRRRGKKTIYCVGAPSQSGCQMRKRHKRITSRYCHGRGFCAPFTCISHLVFL